MLFIKGRDSCSLQFQLEA